MLSVKIQPMQKSDLDGVILIEEKAYGPHHWSKESFLSELSNELAKYFSVFNDFSVYNKANFPWAVHICEAKCTCGRRNLRFR